MASIISAYDDSTIAEKAIAALRKEGFENGDIRILKGDKKKLMSTLAEQGFDEDDVREYADAADEGKTLLLASVSEDEAEKAESIMDSFESGDDKEEGSEKSSGGSVPIVEEELSVAKSKSANGGARVTSSVTETPVEETVTLKEETVKAKRKDADHVLDSDEAEGAFEEKTVEMMGTKEEAEVKKEARVVGEVEIEKEAKERQKTVKDTVRKTDAEVEEVGTGSKKKK
jgi:stress response protein YsnF